MSKKNWNKLVTVRTLKDGDRILVDDPEGRMHIAVVDGVYPSLFRKGCRDVTLKDRIQGQRYMTMHNSTKVIKVLDDYQISYNYNDPSVLDQCCVISLMHKTVHFVDLDLTVTGGVA
jgi:hypothetical protein